VPRLELLLLDSRVTRNRPVFRAGPASAKDLIRIRALLERSGLPTSDLESARPEFAVIRADDQVIAAGALQRFGSSALLRSVVVAPDRRRSGLGKAIVSEVERLARAHEVSRLVLLTQTAAEFFARQGYRVIERSSAPPDLQGSEEFRSLCPSSATCMAKSLDASIWKSDG
jgi:amino-acid N-acetyltransferase